MKVINSSKFLIVILLCCIVFPTSYVTGSAYFELPYEHEKGTSIYRNVKIDEIYYDIDIDDAKFCPAKAMYPVKKEKVLKIPNKIEFNGKKYKVKSVEFDPEYSNDYPSKMVLPYRVIYLPKYATSFYRSKNAKLPNLKKLYVSKNTNELIGINDMPNLKVIIDKKNPYIKMKNGAVYSKNGKKLLTLVNSKKKYKVAEGTEYIYFGNAGNRTVEKIILPSSIKKINMSAFAWWFKLKNIKLNNELKVIEDCAFEKCKSLKKITIPENVEKIEFWAFKNCKKLSKVKLESEEKSPAIENTAFKNTKDGIKFVVKNQTVADQLKEQLKGSGVKNAKILVGKKVVYTNVK